MLCAEDLSFGYGDQTIIRHFSARFRKGEFVGILGPNGSGKTTLLSGLACLLSPKGGYLKFCGQDLFSLSSKKRARILSSVPQKPRLPEHMLVRDFVFLGRYAYLPFFGRAAKRDWDIVESALEKTNTQDLAGRPLATLSGGQIQRVLLAQSLCQEAPLLILDELSSALDIKGGLALFDLLHGLAEEGHLILTASHDCNLARAYCTRLIGLRNGRVLFDRKTDEAFTAKHLEALHSVPMQILAPVDEKARIALPKKLLNLVEGVPLPHSIRDDATKDRSC
ncbi:MAG: ABC transporter ATP-binding protein [Desulfovibrio sp.]|nr:ABC transporter ATP-binding protein [Desulfovibrio sp.]